MIRLNIITPSTRPNNLNSIKESIEAANSDGLFNIYWYVVFDANHILCQPESKTININTSCLKNLNSVYGNAQRNYALDSINEGWVYFLDDDNLLHPELLRTLQRKIEQHPEIKAFLGAQSLDGDRIRKATHHLNIGKVDAAQVCLDRQVIGRIRWSLHLREADALFIQALTGRTKFQLLPEIIAYYNALVEQ